MGAGGDGTSQAARQRDGAPAKDAASASVGDSEQDDRVSNEPVWSSGVAFYPPSRKYWRIGGKWCISSHRAQHALAFMCLRVLSVLSHTRLAAPPCAFPRNQVE